MKKQWRKYLAAVIAIVSVGMILWIYPFQKAALIPYESNYGKGEVFGTGNITQGKTVVQSFDAGRTQLQSTSIYMQNLQESVTGSLIAVLSKDGRGLKEVKIPLYEIANYEWHPIVWNTWLEETGTYTITITTDAPDEGVLQIFATTPDNGPKENREYWYNNTKGDNITLAVNYQYADPAGNFSDAVPFAGMVILAAALLVEIIYAVGGKKHA